MEEETGGDGHGGLYGVGYAVTKVFVQQQSLHIQWEQSLCMTSALN